jgi:hypothetical protein
LTTTIQIAQVLQARLAVRLLIIPAENLVHIPPQKRPISLGLTPMVTNSSRSPYAQCPLRGLMQQYTLILIIILQLASACHYRIRLGRRMMMMMAVSAVRGQRGRDVLPSISLTRIVRGRRSSNIRRPGRIKYKREIMAILAARATIMTMATTFKTTADGKAHGLPSHACCLPLTVILL